MILAVRGGESMRSVARRLGVSPCTVQRWVGRGRGKRADRIDLADRPGGRPVGPHCTPAPLEDLVLSTRADLKANSDLGEYGAAAVHDRLVELGVAAVPSARTINRICQRRGAFDAHRRVRRPAPPPGWYLADLCARRVELDSFDGVEGLVIGKTPAAPAVDVEVLNGVSLHGGLACSWPTTVVTARFAADRIVDHWREVGLPRYAQFDNGTVFHGPHARPDTFGRVTRLCLSLGVVPVFAPPRETGFQAAVENYNGRWQAKVWARFKHPVAGVAGGPVGPVRRRRPAPRRTTHRAGPAAAAVPGRLVDGQGDAEAPGRPRRVPPPQRRRRPGLGPGPQPPGRPGLAGPAGPGRRRPGRGGDPLPRAPPATARRPSAAVHDAVHAADQAVPGVTRAPTLGEWHLPSDLLSSDLELLSLGRLEPA